MALFLCEYEMERWSGSWHGGEFVIAPNAAKARQVYREHLYSKQSRDVPNNVRALEIVDETPRLLDAWDEARIIERADEPEAEEKLKSEPGPELPQGERPACPVCGNPLAIVRRPEGWEPTIPVVELERIALGEVRDMNPDRGAVLIHVDGSWAATRMVHAEPEHRRCLPQ